MSDDKLNPILQPDCEPCAEQTEPRPTACPEKEEIDLKVKVFPREDCPSCDDEIVPKKPTIADHDPKTKCLTADPAYEYLPATDVVGGRNHTFYLLHPACAVPVQNCGFCVENNVCDEDIGLSNRYGLDNVFSVSAENSLQPIIFYVADNYLDRVHTEQGYIKVAQNGNHNEWMPREHVENSFLISPAAMFPIAQSSFFNEKPNLGTVPAKVTETPWFPE